ASSRRAPSPDIAVRTRQARSAAGATPGPPAFSLFRESVESVALALALPLTGAMPLGGAVPLNGAIPVTHGPAETGAVPMTAAGGGEAGGGGGRTEGGAGAQRGRVQPLQRLTGAAAERVGKLLVTPPVSGQRVGLPATPVQRQHKLGMQALAQRVVGHQPLQLRGQHGVTAQS